MIITQIFSNILEKKQLKCGNNNYLPISSSFGRKLDDKCSKFDGFWE